jgi:hypothetical protein
MIVVRKHLYDNDTRREKTFSRPYSGELLKAAALRYRQNPL